MADGIKVLGGSGRRPGSKPYPFLPENSPLVVRVSETRQKIFVYESSTSMDPMARGSMVKGQWFMEDGLVFRDKGQVFAHYDAERKRRK